jgi:membrane protease YdiL (CAAX protease family)
MSKLNDKAFSENRRFGTEIVIVLALSLGASAVYSILYWLNAVTSRGGLAGTKHTLNASSSANQLLDAIYQIANNALQVAPAVLVVFLVAGHLGRTSLSAIGGISPTRTRDFAAGLGLAAAIGIPGIALYFFGHAIGATIQIVPSTMQQYWWVVPVLLLSALRSAVLEEFVMIGYLFKRLDTLGWSKGRQIWLSAVIRGLYHLYQGYSGFFGNIAMGLIFGWLYKKYGRLQWLVIAHFILDAATYVGYAVIDWAHIRV